jgi:hypothetical protein
MNGILNPMPQGILSDPRQAAMLQAGLGLLQASGPSRTPVGLGQAIGQAGMQGINAFHQTNQANQQNQIFQMKLAEVQREAEERKRRAADLAALEKHPSLAGLPPELLRVAPNVAFDRAFPKPKETPNPFSRLNPKDYTPESLTKYQQTGNVADLVAAPAQDDDFSRSLKASGVQPGSPEWVSAHRDRATKLRTSSPLVQMGQEETAFQKKVGAEFGEQYAGLLRADMNAPATIAKYERLGSLLGQIKTGKFKGTVTDIKAAAKSVGIDLASLGVTDDVGTTQAAQAFSNQLALELRNPAGGAGMPGALSDKDREFLIRMVAGIENDPEAWPKMIEYRVKLAKREQQVAKMARAYRKKHGKFDEGFHDELAEWSAQNPLFQEAQTKPTPPAATPAGVVDFGSLK